MKKHKKPPIDLHPWKIITRRFDPEFIPAYESIFSIGNGYMGQRANFEEDYSGPHLQGTYTGGIYYPDKTRVGWWKVGYPEYFAKVPNSPNWIGIHIKAGDEILDLFQGQVSDFRMELDMQRDLLIREFSFRFPSGKILRIQSQRFISMHTKPLGAIRYQITSINFDGEIQVAPYIDGGIKNSDANYGEYFWDIRQIISGPGNDVYVTAETRKTKFGVCTGMLNRFYLNGQSIHPEKSISESGKKIAYNYHFKLHPGDELVLEKYAAVTHTLDIPYDRLHPESRKILEKAAGEGWEKLLNQHVESWKKIWQMSDIQIQGDTAAQQGIRYNILQLNHTYTGHDPRLNIGPKGFTGEKYGGGTYWDTEAFCLPFYLGTKNKNVAKNLLLYRYRHLPKAIENAEKLGFNGGAALYPMVTMNGEESHNEWEITFEEIHRNGAIVYAIYNYVNYTGDESYIRDYGMEVMIAIARFWAQRFSFSQAKKKYVLLGVTGPNEYENNVNNNWYTAYIARWNLEYTLDWIERLRIEHPEHWRRIEQTTGIRPDEIQYWRELTGNIYFPYDEEHQIFLQQDGFLDKEIRPASSIPHEQRPINQHWSWDRILRSCFIKQADVLQGMYFFENHFTRNTLKRHFEFYEPLTVHESSLSPCVHAILASSLDKDDKAYELYLRTARLDLDDYNAEVHEGLHITSMAGTWLAVVQGFGGMRSFDGRLSFRPKLPAAWTSLDFKINYRDRLLRVHINRQKVEIENLSEKPIGFRLFDSEIELAGGKKVEWNFQNREA